MPDETYSTVYVHDQLDRLVRVTDNAGQTTHFGYDSRDNLIFQSDPEGAPVLDKLRVFTQAGQVGQINEEGNTKHYDYDGLNRLLKEAGSGHHPLRCCVECGQG